MRLGKTQMMLRVALLACCAIGVSLSCSSPERRAGPRSLPPLKVDPFAGLDPLGKDEKQAFRFRPGPKPPPSITKQEKLSFPAGQGTGQPKSPPKTAPGELKVLRYAPRGDAGKVGAVTVTFNQPMVPVAALAELAQHKAPVRIAPHPAGRFRWLGTQTLAFEPEGRMPFGTEYTVTVPAGTRSAIGGTLERQVRFSFTTPRPKILRALPPRYGGQARPDTVIALELNQRVDQRQLLSLIKLTPDTNVQLQLVDRSRWEKLRDVGHYVATWDPERTVVLRPTRELRKGTYYTVSIAPGLRGEGPRTTAKPLTHHFSTYAPLQVIEIRCGDYQHCNPAAGFFIRFNNPLITEAEKLGSFIKVTPEPVGGIEVQGSGAYAYLRGEYLPRTSYSFTVGKGPVDIHDQELSKPYAVTRKTGDRTPDLRFPVQGLATLERSGKRQVPLEVVNVGQSRLRMVRVSPEQILTALEKSRHLWDDGGRRDPLKGFKGIVVRRTLLTGVPRNGKSTIGIDTDEALGPKGAGPVFIELRSPELKRQNRWANPLRGVLVQVTDIGLMARYDNDRIVGWVSQMQTGRALSGAALELRDRDGKVIWRGKTDGKGMLDAPGRRKLKAHSPFVLWVHHGGDRAFVILDGRGDDGDYLSTYARWGSIPPEKTLRMHLFTDRSPYRPEETVHLKGVLRVMDTRPEGGIEPLPRETREVSYTVTSPRGHKIAEGKAPLSESGAFAVDAEIPAGADLGAYRVEVIPTGGPLKDRAYGSFQVEEYRPPEFKVKVEVEGEPYFWNDKLKARVGADYLFGAPMSGACSWTLTRNPGHFAPPNNAGFAFGEPIPFRWGWRLGRTMRRHRGGLRAGYTWQQQTGQGEIVESGEGMLGEDGRLAVSAKLAPDPEDKRIGPLSFTLEAQVVDLNRQSIADRKSFVVHPASVYVGLRAKKTVVKAGEQVQAHAVLTDLAGARITGKQLTVEAVREETKVRTVFEDGRWTYKYETTEKKAGQCSVTTADEARACAVTLPRPGGYLLRAEARDDDGRRTRTAIRVYAFGEGYVPWNLKNQSQIELVPDKESYRPGETARVLVKSPLRQATGLLAILRGGIERAELYRVTGTAQVIEVPIRAHHLPAVYVSLALARPRITDPALGVAAKDLGRPTFAHGTVQLPVVTDDKQIKVEVKPAKDAVGPSEQLKIRLQATDDKGRPARAELAVMLVDEGVLSLLGYVTPDPLAFFFAERGRAAPLSDLRNALLARQKDLAKERKRRQTARQKKASKRKSRNRGLRGPAEDAERESTVAFGALARAEAGDGKAAGRAAPAKRASGSTTTAALDDVLDESRADKNAEAPRIRARSHFATTAYYNPAVNTDEKGRAEITVKMPDNTTTYRIMAVALDRGQADRFGSAEAQVQVRKPLLLRPSLPRFLSVGDRFEAAVMVHNQTAKQGTIDVLVRGRNAEPTGESRVRVRIPAERAREVRFSMKVQHAGPARVQFAAVLDNGAQTDAVEKQVPVLLPVTTEAFATYGMTDDSVAQPVVPPENALAGYGGLEISMSSTALNGLEDSVRYLVTYPYECTEQTASRVLPIFSLERILGDFNIASLKDSKRRDALARSGVRKLIAFQRYDGGWGNWQGSTISWPYVSAYASYALLRAKASGEQVPAYNLNRAKQFLKQRLDHPLTEFGEQYNWVAQAASVWVLSEMGQHERDHLGRLYGLRRRLPLFARAWLMVALFRAEGRSGRVNDLLRELDNAAVQTASAAHFAEGKTESLRLLMHSDDRTDAIVLQALLEVAPTHPLMPKIARGLLQARVRGAWSTTQANAFALGALARYYKQVEKQVPDHVSQIWYGEGYMGEGAFKGRQMKVVQQQIPLDDLRKLGSQSLLLAKRGQGKLYYRIGLRYAPEDLTLPPEEQGFAVSRLYEPIADAKGKVERTVRRRPDGSWEIKAGATVRVRVVLVVPDRRYFVAVADPLPAGLEGVNLKFKTSARTRLSGQLDNQAYDTWSWYSLLAFDHREMRDDRVVLFADRLPAGVYEYTYLARATTFGSFVVAPTKAEEMYHPETFGRSGTAFVHVVK